MNLFLISFISFAVTFILYIPFIGLLYKLKLREPIRDKHRVDAFGQQTRIFDLLKAGKAGTPTGGGILTVLLSLLFFIIFNFFPNNSVGTPDKFFLIFLTFLLFGLIGFYDDVRKVFQIKDWGLRVRHKLFLQLASAGAISFYFVWRQLGYLNFFNFFVITDPILIFLISVFVIVWMTNAFNIIDGIDGLSSGLLVFTLIPLWVIFSNFNFQTELLFISILFGANLAYLYFNINPARLFMGDTGALGIGAVLGLLLLLSGELHLFFFLFVVYHIDSFSSLLQWASRKFRNGKKIFMIAPIHHHFEAVGWESTKVVFRFWIAQIVFSLFTLAIFGL